MTTITPFSQTNISTPSNGQVENIVLPLNNASDTDKVEELPSSNTVSLSTRSKVLQELNAEFFRGGKLAFEDIPNYVNKLHEKGLITSTQYQSLGGNRQDNVTASGNGQLSIFVTDLTDALKAESPNHPLIEPLTTAKQTFNQLESGSAVNNIAIAKAQTGFNTFFSSEEFQSLEQSSQQGLIKINEMLGLIGQTQRNTDLNTPTKLYQDIAGF